MDLIKREALYLRKHTSLMNVVRLGGIPPRRDMARSANSPARGPIQKKRYEVIPSCIGVIKSWDSKHTGGIDGSLWAHDRFIDDVMIRKFIDGTFYDLLVSDIVVKRRLNQVFIAIFVYASNVIEVQKVYFMKGFTEKLLSELLGCLVTVELRSGYEIRSPAPRTTA